MRNLDYSDGVGGRFTMGIRSYVKDSNYVDGLNQSTIYMKSLFPNFFGPIQLSCQKNYS
jgi:hypothetical protein